MVWKTKIVPGWSKKKIMSTYASVERARKSGNLSPRLFMLLREKELLHRFDNTIITNLVWFDSLVDEKGPLYGKLGEFFHAMHNESAQLGLSESQTKEQIDFRITELFFVMKMLERSDSAPWFLVHENLMHSFLHTRLSGVKAADVKVPFPGFCMELPSGFLSVDMVGCGRVDLNVLRVAEVFKGGLIEAIAPDACPLGRYIHADATYGIERSDLPPLSAVTTKLDIPLMDDNKSIDQLVLELDGLKSKVKQGDSSCFVFGQPCPAEEYQDILCSLVVNFLLYISSPNADKVSIHEPKIRQFRKRKKTALIKNKIKQLQQIPEWIVGSKIIVDSKLREMAATKSAIKRQQRAVNVLVRGHWRHMWHGKKTEESPRGEGRHWTWVQPFVRNRATGAVLGHQYEVR